MTSKKERTASPLGIVGELRPSSQELREIGKGLRDSHRLCFVKGFCLASILGAATVAIMHWLC
jgi:hypothetical protein